ncbi:hypothetical protein K2173_004605 [Erythroxylum novogranatense]|uniref:DUF7731 domain-containing protein n=1 Tax=Erythroxylum novogranatense TaxID=1862640 RepID=A0AAV8S637_9ROSI|nr:hypothetical protein K2173_004605 [Erythroxylum novogranatense]
MANSLTVRISGLEVAIVCIFLFWCNIGKGAQGAADVGRVHGPVSRAAVDTAGLVAKAVLCFSDNQIYNSCKEAHRLNATGNLNVSAEHVDAFCNRTCLSGIYSVLNCIEGIMENFKFYNNATINVIRDTIKAGCGSGSARGNFNVTELLPNETSRASNTKMQQILFGLSLIITMAVAGPALLL